MSAVSEIEIATTKCTVGILKIAITDLFRVYISSECHTRCLDLDHFVVITISQILL